MALTAELVARCERVEADPGPDPHLVPLTDDDFRAKAAELAAACDGCPLWLFTYGSLIWKPAFDPLEHRRATAHGWHRAFCLEMRRWRGTPAQPGLMMALVRGGRCEGVAYRLPDDDRTAHIERLLRREMSFREQVRAVRWIHVDTDQGRVRALVFWAGPSGDGVLDRLPAETVARTLARACGHIGSGAAYLYNTVSHLEALGIHDRGLWRLQELVAAEILAMPETPPATVATLETAEG